MSEMNSIASPIPVPLSLHELLSLLPNKEQEEYFQLVRQNLYAHLDDAVLLSSAQACEFLNIGERTLARLIDTQQLSPIKYSAPGQKGLNQKSQFELGDLRKYRQASKTGDAFAQSERLHELNAVRMRSFSALSSELPFVIDASERIVGHAYLLPLPSLTRLLPAHPENITEARGRVRWIALDEALAMDWTDAQIHTHLVAIVRSFAQSILEYHQSNLDRLALLATLQDSSPQQP